MHAQRYAALDGLRGVAALVVVIHHGFLTSPVLADAYVSLGRPPTWAQILTTTPLHVIWAGKEAVAVFFVLSGVVLTLPRLKPDPDSWLAYYPKRMVRLYVPIIAAVLMSIVVVYAVGRRTDLDSWWLNSHIMPSVRESMHDLTVIRGTTSLNTALWSMQWEVWFSLLLPIFVWLAFATRRAGPILGLWAMQTLMLAGVEFGQRALMYLPMFGVGVLVAVHFDRLRDIADRVLGGKFNRIKAVAVVLVAIILLTSEWWTHGLGPRRAIPNIAGVLGVSTGALILVVLTMCSGTVARFLEFGPINWLGTRSFSLYLIHEPIIVSTATLLPNIANPAMVTAIGLTISLLCAEVFCRLIEQPSHRLSRRVGASIDGH
jgi:peptidoglycan/LPS O-acetylase OafA/YrhL